MEQERQNWFWNWVQKWWFWANYLSCQCQCPHTWKGHTVSYFTGITTTTLVAAHGLPGVSPARGKCSLSVTGAALPLRPVCGSGGEPGRAHAQTSSTPQGHEMHSEHLRRRGKTYLPATDMSVTLCFVTSWTMRNLSMTSSSRTAYRSPIHKVVKKLGQIIHFTIPYTNKEVSREDKEWEYLAATPIEFRVLMLVKVIWYCAVY